MKDIVRLSWTGSAIDEEKVDEVAHQQHYDNNEEAKKEELDYIEKILAATATDDNNDGDCTKNENQASSESGIVSNGDNPDENVSKDDGDDIDQREVKKLVNAMKESLDVRNAKFAWNTERDYGLFEVIHFDRPTPPNRIAALLETILEENQLEKTLTDITRNIPTNLPKFPKAKSPCDESLVANVNNKKSNKLNNISALHCTWKNLRVLTNSNTLVSHEDLVRSPVLNGNWIPPTVSSQQATPTSSRPPSSVTKQKKMKKKKKSKPKQSCACSEFNPAPIKKIVKATLTEHFEGKSYDADESKHMCEQLADLIKTKVKYLYPPRYRLICIVSIIEAKKQSLKMASRGLWDAGRDKVTDYCYSDGNIDATCVIYGIYKE